MIQSPVQSNTLPEQNKTHAPAGKHEDKAVGIKHPEPDAKAQPNASPIPTPTASVKS